MTVMSRLRFAAIPNTRSLATQTRPCETTNNSVRPFEEVPGPPSLPFLGAVHNFIPPFGKLANKLGLELSDYLYNTYGPIVRIKGSTFSQSFVFLFDPDTISHVLRNENLMPNRPGFLSLTHYRKELCTISCKGITGLITDQGEHWKEMRSTVNPVMLQPKTIKLYKDVLDEVAEDFMCRSLATQARPRETTNNSVRPFEEVPGPPSLPFLGAVHNFIPPFGKLANKLGLELSDYLYNTYGPIVRIRGSTFSQSFIFLFDPDTISHVLRSENLMPNRPGFLSLTHYRKELSTISYKGTTGLITDQGEHWKEMRSTVNPVMLQPKTIKLYKDVLDEVAEDFMCRLKDLRDENNMIKTNLDVEFNKWALESIAVVSLGGRLGCLDPNLPEDSPVRELIRTVHDIFHYGLELDFKPSLWRLIATPTYKKAMKCYEKQIVLSKYFIKQAVKEINQKKFTSHEKGVLEKLLEIDENVAVIMATDMLFAGVDTAANTMLATLYLLAKNPEKQEKLRSQLLLGDVKYLRAVMKESLRLLPVVSGNSRLSTKEYNLNGYLVPKDQVLIFTHQYAALREEQYPQAKEFLPERWIAKKDDPLYYGNAHPFAMSPFGFGTRQCIGKRIAELEFEAFLTQIMKNFRIEWDGPPIKIKPVSLNYVLGPYSYVFKDL